MLKDMNDTDFNEKIVKEDLTIINYSASWCGPCKQQLPTLKSLAESDEFKHINFYYCDVDNNLNTSTSANIRGVPTLVKYRKGQEVSRKVGAASEADLKAFFKSEE